MEIIKSHKLLIITTKDPFVEQSRRVCAKEGAIWTKATSRPGRRAVSFGIIENCHHHHLLRVGEATRDVYNHKLFKLCHKIPHFIIPQNIVSVHKTECQIKGKLLTFQQQQQPRITTTKHRKGKL